eukprot:GHUV01033457.1.p1 GENE.GHUV01033457.1~~GHUV01033457.1.p1  ORF type:complete len:112 (+),score=20.36 GHUV01033457.1:71-406(+)
MAFKRVPTQRPTQLCRTVMLSMLYSMLSRASSYQCDKSLDCDLLAQVLHSALPRLGDSMLVSSLWGFAVAGFFDGPLCEAGFRRVSQLPATKARPLLLLQLFQAATLTQVR